MNNFDTDRDAINYGLDLSRDITELVQNDNWRDFDDLRDDSGNALSIGAWLEDVLDITYYADSNKRYKGARLLVTFGGPNAWLDTTKQLIEVYWGSGSACRVVDGEFCDLLDEYLAELWSI